MPPPSLTYEQVLKVRKQLFDDAVASGEITPPLWPWDTLIVVYLFSAVFCRYYFTHRVAKILNAIAYTLIAIQSLWIFTNRRSLGAASGYGWGLTMSWGLVMSAVFILMHDVKEDFVRLEWREPTSDNVNEASQSSQEQASQQVDGLRKRHVGGNAAEARPGDIAGSKPPSDRSRYPLIWQGMPSDVYHRIEWSIDLITSFRGPNWNYRIATLPKITVPQQPEDPSIVWSSAVQPDKSSRPVYENSYDSPSAKRRRATAVVKTLASYVLIDAIKCIMITDPYFLGLAPLDSPSPWRIIPATATMFGLPAPFLIRTYRLIVSMTGIISALFLIFSLSPLFFFVIMPNLLVDPRKVTFAPLLDERMYPGFLEFPFPVVADKGLAGFWGRCWHQMFRFGISEPSRLLLPRLGIEPRSQFGRAIQLFIAFTLTGFLHWAGSYTCFSIVPSKPWLPMSFFVLQAVGITLQTFLASVIQKTLGIRAGKTVKRITNSVFVFMWLYITGPLIADDFSRCGIWIFEPVPFSLIRGFRGEGWFVWGGRLVGWFDGAAEATGRTGFWNKGIAVF